MTDNTSNNSKKDVLSGIASALRTPWVAFILLGLFVWMAMSVQLGQSPAFDELPHLTGGYSYWVTNDYRLHPENGILPQRWAALPLLLGWYRFPPPDLREWMEANVWGIGYMFFYRFSNDLDAMLLGGRAMMVLLTAGLGVLVYAWSRTLFGPLGGLISLILFVFSPAMLAHGTLIGSDLPITIFLTAAVWTFWTMLHHVTVRTVLLSALTMAAAFLSKPSGLALAPIVVLLVAIRLALRRPLRVSLFKERHVHLPAQQLSVLGLGIAIQAVVIVAILWSFYGFRFSAFGPVHHDDGQFIQPWENVLSLAGGWKPVIQTARDHHVLPEAYLYGFTYALGQAKSRRGFLNGETRDTGWWYFFPYTLLVKTPLPLFVLLAIAIAGLIAKRRESWYATIPLWVLLTVYWGFTLTSHLNIGQRHILPTYPAMFILAGAAALWFRERTRLLRGLVLVSLAWFIFESVTIRPHYLAYFNQVVGGPAQGYRHLVDSSLDWGQNLTGLKRWLHKHGLQGQDHAPLYLAYNGMGSPAYYGIKARLLTPASFDPRLPAEEALKPLTGGVYVIGATALQTISLRYWGPWTDAYERMYRVLLAEVEEYKQVSADSKRKERWIEERGGRDAWEERLTMFDNLRVARLLTYLRKREPDDQVGYSILIYRLTDEQVREAVYGPAL